MKAFPSSILSVRPLIPAGGIVPAAGAARGRRPPASVRASTTQQPAGGGWPHAYITSSRARLVTDEPYFASWLAEQKTAMYAAVTFGAAVHGLYAGGRNTARRTPRAGSSARGAAAWGPGGATAVASVQASRIETGVRTRQGANGPGSWGR